jgi:uncharacterized protein YbcI
MDEVAQQAPRGTGDGHQSELALLSNGMVRIYKEQFGRGPTKVRTDYAGPDTIISTLENTLTPAEVKLRAMGEGQRLEETRLLFQRACRDDFVRVVEEITGRKVHAFVSGQDADQDVATEIFYLEPRR